MKQLNLNWLTEGWMDFEYKKYLLLAYLQEVSRHFDEERLYPFLNDLLLHYQNLETIRENKTFVSSHFPKKITRFDLEKFTIAYEKMLMDDSLMEELEAILDFAIPQIGKTVETGKELYQEVEASLNIFPVGIVSLNPETGYMMLSISGSRETQVYGYQVTIFENAQERFRGIRTDFIGSYARNLSVTLEEIKAQLIRQFRNELNYAAYAVEAHKEFPLAETLLPVAKRCLVRYLCQPGIA